MRGTIIFLLIAMALSGCVVPKIYTADGKEGYNIDCSGEYQNWGRCYEKAGNICGAKGYEVVEKISDQESTLHGNQYGLHAKSNINRNLIIKCKE